MMKSQIEIQQRFLKENAQMRLGHLASDLSRIASLTEIKMEEEAAKLVMEEAKFFTEWAGTAAEADLETRMFLAEIQGYISLKKLEWDSASKGEEWRGNLRRQLRLWSDELLKRAGFFEDDERF